MQRKDLGVAIIGCGRIGTLRAVMAAAHPAVKFIAVSDRDPARAAKLAERVGAVTGHLRVVAPLGFGRRHVAPVVTAFRRGEVGLADIERTLGCDAIVVPPDPTAPPAQDRGRLVPLRGRTGRTFDRIIEAMGDNIQHLGDLAKAVGETLGKAFLGDKAAAPEAGMKTPLQ